MNDNQKKVLPTEFRPERCFRRVEAESNSPVFPKKLRDRPNVLTTRISHLIHGLNIRTHYLIEIEHRKPQIKHSNFQFTFKKLEATNKTNNTNCGKEYVRVVRFCSLLFQ